MKRVFSAPGRINLIGEHTDYNEGFVLPCALDRRTYVNAVPRDDGRIRCTSSSFPGEITFVVSTDLRPAGDWADLLRGVAAGVLRVTGKPFGADLVYSSDIPVGAGLASSAAFAVVSGKALLALAGEEFEPHQLALLAQRAEHEFLKTHCGLMDQLIACCGSEGHAMLIDCRAVSFRRVPFSEGAEIVICDSGKRHVLASSEYNKRREECEEGAARLGSLRDASLSDLECRKNEMSPVVYRRCRHVISENVRTLQAAGALEGNDLTTFGRLMYASHASLRDDFEVSCAELNSLVDLARQVPGVFGARMMGGGFGGYTVNVVAAESVDGFVEFMRCRSPQVYTSVPSAGLREEK